jgi:perosamine synthetase
MASAGIGPGDEVIVPALTFVATANSVLYSGAKPVFADVCEDTLLLDPKSLEDKMSRRTKAIVAVDYAGQPCDYDELRAVSFRHSLHLFADACHALGASYGGKPVGSVAEASTFSFHPVKPITTGEGGALVTDDHKLAARARIFRNHGIATDFRQREAAGVADYDMQSLGYNCRLPDTACALGLAQLGKLPGWIARRQAIARRYHKAFEKSESVRPLAELPGRTHGYHLFVVRVQGDRDRIFRELRAAGIGVNVHYKPVYLHSFYRGLGDEPGLCPVGACAWWFRCCGGRGPGVSESAGGRARGRQTRDPASETRSARAQSARGAGLSVDDRPPRF